MSSPSSSILAAALAGALLAGAMSPAAADARRLSLMPDPRGEFIRLCAPFHAARYQHPEAVCDCLWATIFANVFDRELIDAIAFGITERGVPTIDPQWLPPDKRNLVSGTITAIAEPTIACMFADTQARKAAEPRPPDGFIPLPAVQTLEP